MNTPNPIMAALLAEETVSEEFKAAVARKQLTDEEVSAIALILIRRSGYGALTDIPRGRRETLFTDIRHIAELLADADEQVRKHTEAKP